MPATILLFYLLAFGAAMFLSWSPYLGNLRNTAANPVLLLAAYAFLVGGDYLSMAVMGGGQLAQHDVIARKALLTWLAFQHAIGFGMLCLGLYIGMVVANRRLLNRSGTTARTQAPQVRQSRQPLAVAVFLGLLLLWFVLLRANGGEDISLADVARTKRNTIGDAALFVTSLLLLPAFTYALPNIRWRTAIVVAVIASSILLYSGSRTRLLYVAVPLFLALAQVYRFRMPRYFFVVALVAAGLMAVIVLNLRLASAFGVGADITSATGGNIFDLNDIPFAESSVALTNLSSSSIESYIGEDFVGAIFAGVPRSIVPFKPLGGSNQFTAIYDPIGWTLYGRGLTIGGINEINFDYPFPLSLVVILLVGGIVGLALANVARSGSKQAFAGSVAIYIVLYQFLKADLQSVGQVVTSFVIYNLVMFALRPLRLGFTDEAPGSGRKSRLPRRGLSPVQPSSARGMPPRGPAPIPPRGARPLPPRGARRLPMPLPPPHHRR